ncbi:amidohydrolase family protein [Micromonospora sp. NPDC050200]|uniref:amidohydrolase family protein n=1 Tax=Micromonospora sp. NPDC050200 TaxID=3155664 RepID=UPI0033FD422C
MTGGRTLRCRLRQRLGQPGGRRLLPHRWPARRTDRRPQPMTLAGALRAYTYGSAYAAGAEDRKGCLVPGLLADLAVLEGPLDAREPAALRELQVALTVLDGEIVFQR